MVPAVRIDFYDADELKVKNDKYKCYSYSSGFMSSLFVSSLFYSSLCIGDLWENCWLKYSPWLKLILTHVIVTPVTLE